MPSRYHATCEPVAKVDARRKEARVRAQHPTERDAGDAAFVLVLGAMGGAGVVHFFGLRRALPRLPRWLAAGRGGAVRRLLVERGMVHHVLDEHGFDDAGLNYDRFTADDPPQRAAI